jgi:hypothetical protein
MAVYALLTNESQKQAKSKMNVINTKSGWTPVNNYNKCNYEITMDGASTIYMATLN